jgi:adenylosuccinate lyase
VAFGHSLLAIGNVAGGLGRLDTAGAVLAEDLDRNWEVLGEAIQMVMRAEAVAGVAGLENPYERLKDLTRGQRVDAARMQEFVSGLGLPPAAQARLLALTPASYIGIAPALVDHLR